MCATKFTQMKRRRIFMKKLIKQCIILLLALITTTAPLPVLTPENPKPPIETHGDDDENPPDKMVVRY